MKHKSLFAYLIILALLSAAFVAGMLLAGQYGAFLAQGYMLLPAVAALLTRAFFDPQRFSDANLSRGRWTDYLKFWLLSLGISALVFVVYTILGAGRWDFSGQAFLARLSEQFAATGQDLASATPAGMTPQMMLWLFFVGGLTTLNILPGLTGSRSLPDLVVVCAPLAGGSHIPRSSHTPGRRNPTSVVGCRHCPHHPGLVGPVFAGDLAGPPIRQTQETAHPESGLVLQGHPHLFGCPGARATTDLAISSFLDILFTGRYPQYPVLATPPLARRPVLFTLVPGSLDKV